MIGFPEILNTKQDYMNCLQLYPIETKVKLQELVNSRYCWFDTEILTEADTGVKDETHRVVDEDDYKIQQEYKEDENAKIFKLGFTVQEIQELIS